MLMAGQLLCASQGNRVSQLAAASPRRLALFYQWDEECFLNLDKKKKTSGVFPIFFLLIFRVCCYQCTQEHCCY